MVNTHIKVLHIGSTKVISNMSLGIAYLNMMKWNNFNWPKGIIKHQNDLEDMHYFHEGNVDVNMVGYDICIMSL